MLLIKITQEVETHLDLVDFLEHVMSDIGEGYKKGDGWELTGEPENDPEEPDIDDKKPPEDL